MDQISTLHNLYQSHDTTTKISTRFSCLCSVCLYSSKYLSQTSLGSVDSNSYKGFTWFIKKLSEIRNNSAINLRIPDTVIFKCGQPVVFLQSFSDKSLKFIHHESLTIPKVINLITTASKSVRLMGFKQNLLKTAFKTSKFYNDFAYLRYMQKDKDNFIENASAVDEAGSLTVMTETEFNNLIWKPSSPIWKNIAYIQSALNIGDNIEESIIHSYCYDSAHLMSTEIDEEIDLDVFDRDYFERIFKNIFRLFYKHLRLKLMSIKAEFVKDNNDRIWMVEVSDIKAEDLNEIISNVTPVLKMQEIKDLGKYLETASNQHKNFRTMQFSQYMKNECDKVFRKVNFNDFPKFDAVPEVPIRSSLSKTPILKKKSLIKATKKSSSSKSPVSVRGFMNGITYFTSSPLSSKSSRQTKPTVATARPTTSILLKLRSSLKKN